MTDSELKQRKDNLWHATDMQRAGAHHAENEHRKPSRGLISAAAVWQKRDVWLCVISVVSCLLLGSCSASFRLEHRWLRDHGYIVDLSADTTMPYNSDSYPYLLSKINTRSYSYYSDLMMGWESDTERCCAGAFKLYGSIEQTKGRRDSIHYNKAEMKDILIIANDRDTLSWTLTEGASSAFDSLTRYKKKNRSMIYNYTADSLPWHIPQSGLDSDWSARFTVCTEPVDIKRIKRIRIEVAFQFDDIIVVRVEKARRRFLFWFEPRQGFVWYGPEDFELISSII